ncbi:unnamed protein product [Mytilus coruscus]|uniref:EGF-like domain-containing protein n=1 Tax=Mytilus coruscus TaxID=42192 RepID=A0A6J8AKJ2_MYTCO|nr:unnamed protein product [Mytilus coruscus]
MQKSSRSTAKFVVLLTYAYVEMIRCTTMKKTDPNVCPKIVSSLTGTQTKLILECCPDYFYQNEKCIACPAGKFGKNCLQPCMPNYHGVQCKKVCNCTDNKKCNPVHGCVCETGYTGSNCSNSCQSGKYGVSCSEECFCANNAGCDPVTGGCLCSAGWFGPHCTKECALGTFGKNCSGICDCPEGAKCDIITGICNSLKDVCVSLKTTDHNVCPRMVVAKNPFESKENMTLECCPDYSLQNGTYQACIAGRYGTDCLVPCLPNYHGVQCKQQCNCAHNKKCDPVQGCVCNEGFNALDGNCTNECHQGFYNISYNFNCSDTCFCRNETFCNPRSGICECSDETLCKNITKKPSPKKHTDTHSVPFITLVNFSAVGMPMLLFACFLLIKQCKHQYQHRPQDSETIGDEIYQGIYCEINDNQLKDQTRVNSIRTGNYNSEKNSQHSTEENYRHNYTAKSLPNLCMYEEELYLNPYCSFQQTDNDYLNPYCALGLGRRVSSCLDLFTLTDNIDVVN